MEFVFKYTNIYLIKMLLLGAILTLGTASGMPSSGWTSLLWDLSVLHFHCSSWAFLILCWYSCLFKGLAVIENSCKKVNILNGWQRFLHSTSDPCSLLAGSAQLSPFLGYLKKSYFIPDNIQIFWFKIPSNILVWKIGFAQGLSTFLHIFFYHLENI